MSKTLSSIIGFLLFIVIIYSLFLPHYKIITDGMMDDSLGFISQYPNPDQSGGFFGGGFYTTFDGFGSLVALFNFGISFFLLIILLLPKSSKMLFNLFLTLFLFSHALIFLEAIAAPFFLSESPALLEGYFLLIVCEIGLLRIVYKRIRNNGIKRFDNPDILDKTID